MSPLIKLGANKMSESSTGYRVLSEIAAYCLAGSDFDTTVLQILTSIRSVLSDVSACLILSDTKRAISLDNTVFDDESIARILNVSQPVVLDLECPGRLLCIPLCHHDGKSGVLVTPVSSLSIDDESFLRAAAGYIAIYISSSKNPIVSSVESLSADKRVQEITAIYEISQALDSIPIDALLELVTEKAAAVMDAQACSLMLKIPEKEELVIKASFGLTTEIIEETRVAYGKGIAGTVAQTGRPMLLSNLQDDPRFRGSNVTPRPDILSSISVPLRDEEGRVQGVLSIRRTSPAAMFNEDDMKVFSVFASQAALAISNAQLYVNLKDRVQELSMLYEAGRTLSGAYRLEDAADALVRVAAEIGGGDSVMLLLCEGRHDGNVQASLGVTDEFCRSVSSSMDDDAISWIRGLREPRRWLLENTERRPSTMRPLADVLAGAFGWVNLIPLVAEDAVIGALVLGDRTGKRLDQRRVRLLSIVASQAAVVIKNAKSYEEQMDRRVLELSALYELSERIGSAATLNEACELILDIVRDIVWCDECFICTADAAQEMMTIQVCRGEGCEALKCREFGYAEDSFISLAVHDRKALVSPDVRKDSRISSPGIRNSSVRSLMAIPLVVHDEVVGVLNVHGYVPGVYTDENVKVLSVIASQAAALYKELEALSALTNYTDNILRSIAAAVVTLDKAGNVLTWNRAAEGITGMLADSVVGMHFAAMISRMGITDADKEALIANITGVLQSGNGYLGYKQEFHVQGKPNLYININVALLKSHTGEALGLVIIFEDVTKQMVMENEMRRISELAAVGQLAANIAHEIRNPLSSIKGAAQFVRKEYMDDSTVREFLDIIIEEVDVLNKITTEFLDYSKPSRLSLRAVDINSTIMRTIQFMQVDIAKYNVSVERRLADDIPEISADERQLDQVFRNIVLNALQAMPQGGRLTVASRRSSQGVKVSFADTGVGIPEEQISEIFVPFFTTKTKGTGIGLALVKKIIENHGGDITVVSELGRGARFEIFLPTETGKPEFDGLRAKGDIEQDEVDLFRRAQAGSKDM